MIEVGHYSLAVAVLASLATVLGCVAAVRLDKPKMVRHARWIAASGVGGLILAAAALAAALLGDDFTLMYVAEHSERAMTRGYKLAAFWSGQEGSILLWGLVLGLMSLVAAWTYRGKSVKEEVTVVATLAVVWGFFASLMVFAADPFAPTPFVVADGTGLNPLLQNPAMVIHPPVLFLGYAGFTVPFAILMGVLAAGRRDGAWIDSARRWVLTAWLFLSVGIVLGAWWAYVELGWGGYWAWDPVENASLLPWLTATALLHTLVVQKHRGMMKRANAALLAGTFLLCILGTYLTRSGVVQSVHAFSGGLVSWFFLIMLGLGVVVTAALLAWRWRALDSEQPLESLAGREGMFLIGGVLLVVMMLTTLVGTIFPLISSLFVSQPVSVGPEFYNKVVGPMGLVVALLLATAPVLGYGKDAARRLTSRLLGPFILAVAGVLYAVGQGLWNVWALATTGIAILAVTAMAAELVRAGWGRRCRDGEPLVLAVVRIVGANHRFYGAQLAHAGLMLIIVGVVGSSVFQQEHTLRMRPGETAQVGRYTLAFDGLTQTRAENYDAVEAVVRVTDPRGGTSELRPQKRFYFKSEQPNTEVAIRANWREDVYVTLAGWDEGGGMAAFEAFVNPLVSWIWIGATLMAAGAGSVPGAGACAPASGGGRSDGGGARPSGATGDGDGQIDLTAETNVKTALTMAVIVLGAGVAAFGQATQPCEKGDGTCPVPTQADNGGGGEAAAVLPTGHPPIGGGPASDGGQLPAGHPPIGGTSAAGQMPEGHPPIGGAMGMPGGDVQVAAEPVKAELAIRATQGTAGGPAVAGDEVNVQLYAGHRALRQIDTKLDEHGVVMIDDLMIDQPVQPMVTVKHKGVSYEAVGGVLSPQQRRGTVDVTVYEPTEEAPAWTVKIRHVMVQASPGGLSVAEVLVVQNPSDKAWLGAAGEDGKRQTVAVQLPQNLEKVQIVDGFHDCCTTLAHGRLANGMPLLPGEQQFRYVYEVPATDGKAEVKIAAPVATQRVMVFLPDDGTQVSAQGLETMGPMNMGARSSRVYRAQTVAADQAVGFVVEGLSALPAQPVEANAAAEGAAEAKSRSGQRAKAVAGVGGGVAGVGILGLLFLKGPKKAAAKAKAA